MWLVDTSVWIDHFRSDSSDLRRLLEDGMVVTHEFVIGELACGRLKDREAVLGFFESLPRVALVSHSEFLHFVGAHQLEGTGLNFVDIHLLASSRLTEGVQIWTRDERLSRAAGDFPVH
ncbi:type II toxin-antitoxin system VapC family toxin [Congregibacter litoralis]|uniref:Putative nucleic acid-binding protein n=1 Tax=Congregibacter litoralis KT71 TaxID=314285 RepID=A4A597_9GAMM|nr:type II toxin-antitoxin system VapC family toxin [Congregibacter litoralis]EAQ98968.1 putative nucleic acid-binding protein [Congregibacter litoralis KT71]